MAADWTSITPPAPCAPGPVYVKSVILFVAFWVVVVAKLPATKPSVKLLVSPLEGNETTSAQNQLLPGCGWNPDAFDKKLSSDIVLSLNHWM